MSVVSEEIYCLLVPFGPDRLIVPRSCIAEVIRFNVRRDQESSAGWFRGKAVWNNLEIPVVSFETLCGREAPVPSGRTRVIVFHPLSASADCPAYGILSEGFPQMVKVIREVLVLDKAYRAPEGIPLICQVSMLKEQALIPDLEMLETRIAAELAVAS